MSLGKIEIKDKESGSFSFINKIGEEEKHIFDILSTENADPIEKESFAKFGSAMSPYTKGEITQALAITDSLEKNLKEVKGYVESILIHELTDHDNNENSMIEAEEYAIRRIQDESELTDEEKKIIIKYHLGFFEGNKTYYEKRFKKYAEAFKEEKNQEMYHDELNHYNKICEVISYLEGIVK